MKALFYTLLIFIILSAVCAFTCPDKDAHKEALTEMMDEILNQEISEGLGIIGTDLSLFDSLLGTEIGEWTIDSVLDVKDYFLFSIGYITYDGEKHPVSFGIFNHVFTPDKELAAKLAEY